MKVLWKGKHPHGGTITHIEITKEAVANCVLPEYADDRMLLKSDNEELANTLGVKTKWFCLTIV